VSVFNNSLRTRTPLFARRPASSVASLNNAVEFAGCGDNGDPLCRQEPATDPECVESRRHWTADKQALYADCFDFPAPSGPVTPNVFRNNAFNRALAGAISKLEVNHKVMQFGMFERNAAGGDARRLHEDFRLPHNSPLGSSGCAVAYGSGGVICDSGRGPIGAMRPDGARFDLALPFSYPFAAAVELAKGMR
jgi:hypothetical protein